MKKFNPYDLNDVADLNNGKSFEFSSVPERDNMRECGKFAIETEFKDGKIQCRLFHRNVYITSFNCTELPDLSIVCTMAKDRIEQYLTATIKSLKNDISKE